jgi:hypothetical protein
MSIFGPAQTCPRGPWVNSVSVNRSPGGCFKYLTIYLKINSRSLKSHHYSFLMGESTSAGVIPGLE